MRGSAAALALAGEAVALQIEDPPKRAITPGLRRGRSVFREAGWPDGRASTSPGRWTATVAEYGNALLARSTGLAHVRRLRALGALLHVEFYFLSLGEAAEALGLD